MPDGSSSRRTARVINVRSAGPDQQVASVQGGALGYRRTPCRECPWVVENRGHFPPEAFQHSAATSHDAAVTTFACHMTPLPAASMCAGFLLAHSEHNVSVRILRAAGRLDLDQVHDDGRPLFDCYAEMAIEHGVNSDDPCLDRVRSNTGWYRQPDPTPPRTEQV